VRLWNTLYDPQAVHLPGIATHASFTAPDRLTVIAGNFMREFDPATGRELSHAGPALYNTVPLDALGFAHDPQGRWATYFRRDRQEVERRDLRTGKALSPFKLRQGRIAAGGTSSSLLISPDGQYLAYHDHTEIGVILWETKTGKEVWHKPGIRVKKWAFSPDSRRLIAMRDGEPLTLEIWDSATGSVLQRWPTDFANVTALACLADGSRLAMVGHNQQGPFARVVDTATGQQVLQLGDAASCMAFSPDGRRIATGHPRSDAVQIWDAQSGRLVLVLGGTREEPVKQLLFSPDSRFLVVHDFTNLFRVYDGSPWGGK
jgi:WD40 repeat protein